MIADKVTEIELLHGKTPIRYLPGVAPRFKDGWKRSKCFAYACLLPLSTF